ncbi:hypothetical protein LCGC14_2054810 [marine sediment metagenome]|uniref:Uncharacterized protein n=1 Tax=marine sediment metagenome TaxID=412755 RepID=A0A0F9EMW2_9ZZZZ
MEVDMEEVLNVIARKLDFYRIHKEQIKRIDALVMWWTKQEKDEVKSIARGNGDEYTKIPWVDEQIKNISHAFCQHCDCSVCMDLGTCEKCGRRTR